MKREVDVKAWIGDRIEVPALELKPVAVVSVHFTRDGPRYEIAYFHNGDRKTAYVQAHEFAVLPKP